MLELVGSVSTMLHCFPEVDTRILTSWGMLFLDQIQALEKAGHPVLFGCYDVESKALLYSTGHVVLRPRPPPHLLDFTSPGEEARWTANSGVYGEEDDDADDDDGSRSRHLSIRVTPEHEMFVQTGNKPKTSSVAWSATRAMDPVTRARGPVVVAPPRRVAAQELYSTCRCPPPSPVVPGEKKKKGKENKANKDKDKDKVVACVHRRGHVRMLAFAPTGHVPQVVTNGRRAEIKAALHLNDAQFIAFIELFGFWLGDGSMSYRYDGKGHNGVLFAQVKDDDVTWLKAQFALVGLTESSWRNYKYEKEHLLITDVAWFTFFDLEFGAKYALSSRSVVRVTVLPTKRPLDPEEDDDEEDDGEPTPVPNFPPGWGVLWGPSVTPEGVKSVKHLPAWTLVELTRDETRLLIDGVYRADGAFATGVKEIYTSGVRFRDQLLQALLHCGYSAFSIVKYKADAIRGYVFHDQSSSGSTKKFAVSFVESLPPEERHLYRPIQATTAGWRVSWAHLDHPRNTPAAGSCMPSMPRQGCITRVPYDAARDGRTWCVRITHKDHLIIAQRAFRDPNSRHGAVTKQSRPIIVGNCQMMRDVDCSDKAKKMLPFFCEENYTGKVVKEIPAVKSISHFLKQVFEVGQFHPECCVISLVYINRLIGVTGVPLTQSNWKPVAISALVLAQKVWDDTPLINADFSILYPALTVKEINFLERKFLDLLEFKLAVSPSLYAQYYFELRSICEENANAAAQAAGLVGGAARGGSGLGALSKVVLKKVEVRSHLSEEYQKDKQAYKRRSMTIEDIGAKHTKTILS